MSKVIRTPLAKQDLAEIWEYIAYDKLDAANAHIAKIDETFLMLAARPFAGRARDEFAADLRSFPVGRHLILYRKISGGVEVVRVLHGQRDLKRIKLQ